MYKNKIVSYPPEHKSSTLWRRKVDTTDALPSHRRNNSQGRAQNDGQRSYGSSYTGAAIKGHLERQPSIIDRKRRRSDHEAESSSYVLDLLEGGAPRKKFTYYQAPYGQSRGLMDKILDWADHCCSPTGRIIKGK